MQQWLYQLGNVLLQEYDWSRAHNHNDSSSKTTPLYANKCILQSCFENIVQVNVLWEEERNPFGETKWFSDIFLQPIRATTKSLESDMFGLPGRMREKAAMANAPSPNPPQATQVECGIRLAATWIGEWMDSSVEKDSKQLVEWLENIQEEANQVYPLFLYSIFKSWKTSSQFSTYPAPFSLETASPIHSALGMPLKTISKWKEKNKNDPTKLSSKNTCSTEIHFHTAAIEYDDPLDDFLHIAAGDVEKNHREQVYHSTTEESGLLYASLRDKTTESSLLSLNIPKDTCPSMQSLTQRLIGSKSILLLPPPLEILSMGLLLTYHYLTENQRCLWIVQDEYSFVAALLQNYIGPQLVLQLSSLVERKDPTTCCCFLCPVHQLCDIPRDEEFSLVVYTAQSYRQCHDAMRYWEFCIPFVENSQTSLFSLSSTTMALDKEPHAMRMPSFLLQNSEMHWWDIRNTTLEHLWKHLRQTWITLSLSGYQIEGLKMTEEQASEYILQLQSSCNLSMSRNVHLMDLSTQCIENTLYKARNYIQQHHQTLEARKPSLHDGVSHTTTTTTTYFMDIQNLITLHTLRTTYDYVQHDGLYAASKYLECAQKRYGSMLPCMKHLQDTLEDLGQVDKLLHPKTDLVIKTIQQLKQEFQQHRQCLPNFRDVPFCVLIVTNTRYTAHILKRDLYNRGMKKGVYKIVQKTNLGDIRPYYAIVDISLMQWKTSIPRYFHQTLHHWPMNIATQLYQWIVSQVVQYRCVVVLNPHGDSIQDSLDWSRHDEIYHQAMQSCLPRLFSLVSSHKENSYHEHVVSDGLYGIYGMELGTVELDPQGLESLLSYLIEVYPHFEIIFLCCLLSSPRDDRKQMIRISTSVQWHPDYRQRFSIKYFFHLHEYERWLNSSFPNKQYQIVRDLWSAKAPTPHFQLRLATTSDDDKQTKLKWKITNNNHKN